MDILRTKVNNKFLFVEINEQLIENIPDFIKHVLNAHSVNPKKYDVTLFDQYGTPITADFFSRVIRKYVNGCSSDFFIELNLVSVENDLKSPSAIRENLESFLKESKYGQEAINSYEETKNLEISTRQKVCYLTCDFIEEYFNYKAKPDNVRLVCAELIEILPCLKVDPSKIGGIDLLYNSSKSSGFIYNIIKYRKDRARKIPKENNNNIEVENNNLVEAEAIDAIHNLNLDEDITEITDEDKKEILLFFKSCLAQSGRSALLEKLRATVKFRCEILQDKNKDLREIFPFYFTSPDIILEDFNIRWADCNNKALKEKWPLISTRINEWNERNFQKKFDHIDPNINLFIKLFNRVRQRRVSLADALKYFIVIDLDPQTDPLKKLDPKIDSPYIICIGSDKTNVQYFLHIGKKAIIPVPEKTNFLDTFDLFFKIFKVFILKYNPKYENILNFFGRNVYQTNETIEQSPLLLELKNNIFGAPSVE